MPRQRVRHQWGVLFLALVLIISGFVSGINSSNHHSWVSCLLFLTGLVFLLYFCLEQVNEEAFWARGLNEHKGFLKLLDKEKKIVVIGGGTGLGTILRGLKKLTPNLTAIVTVADDGGSSGRLREEFGILPPGDIRNCLIAMADLEPLMEQLMQYRFDCGTGLSGHSFGNLFLTAMTGITGDFQKAIEASAKVLAVRGQIFAATLDNAKLRAELKDGSIVNGESTIGKSKAPIRRIYLEPTEARAVPESLQAIKEADLIIIGPGSLFTSLIPPLLVKEVLEAVKAASAAKVYICNAMPQAGETDGFTAADHLQALLDHTAPRLVDYMIINNQEVPSAAREIYAQEGAEPVRIDLERVIRQGVTPIVAPLLNTNGLVRHDADLLAHLLSALTPSLLKREPLSPGRVRRLLKRIKTLTNLKLGIISGLSNMLWIQEQKVPVKFDFILMNLNYYTPSAFVVYPNKKELFRELLPTGLDLNRYLVIGMFLGERPSGGYAITPVRVDLKASALFIYYREEKPHKVNVMQRLTYPAALLTIEKKDLPSDEMEIYFINEEQQSQVVKEKIFF
ncbi:MAG: uridine diphosphate-N-acetylglucosamine-binding protein YvcK [Firmicutes bacterium]|nr:uridine diphosphate-N-acetylglucosamine-binding protein YvcK [Bacillota bacterium]